MSGFAYIVFPASSSHLLARFPRAIVFPPGWRQMALPFLPPFILGDTVLPNGRGGLRGWVLACPAGRGGSGHKLRGALHLAGSLGAQIAGLEAPPPDLLKAGLEPLPIALSTGSLVRAAALTRLALQELEGDGDWLEDAKVVIQGADSSLGEALAWELSSRTRHLALVGRRKARVEALAGRVLRDVGLSPRWATELGRVVEGSNLVFLAEPGDIIWAGDLSRCTLVVDLVERDRTWRGARVLDQLSIGYPPGLGDRWPDLVGQATPALVETYLRASGQLPPQAPRALPLNSVANLLEKLRIPVWSPEFSSFKGNQTRSRSSEMKTPRDIGGIEKRLGAAR